MAGELRLALLGNPEIRFAGRPPMAFGTNKAQALLCYLALTGRPHLRPALAGLLWGELPEANAHNNLRKALSNLRQLAGPHLDITRQAVSFDGDLPYWLDAEAFEALAGGPSRPGRSTPASIEDLEQAIALYRGDLLEGFYVRQAPAFEEWLRAQRTRLRELAVQVLQAAIAHHASQGEAGHAPGIGYAARLLALEPWREGAHRHLMQLLAQSGQRGAALAQYEACRQALAEELGVEPGPETTRLYEEIRDGTLTAVTTAPAILENRKVQPPAFLAELADQIDRPLFVARERELAWLDERLEAALVGQGNVVFVTGGPGRGKTALLSEFARQAMAAHDDLLVASGSCNAYSGVGDPFLPFREVLAMLTGDVEAAWSAGAISRDHALRLWAALPVACQALLDHGPHVVPALIPGPPLLDRAAAAAPADATWLSQLKDRLERRRAAAEALEETDLFQQVTNLLRALAGARPLLLVLDDLQWADTASVSLLFHLGRRLEGARILIAGAYRAEEIALGRPPAQPTVADQVEQHPLAKVLSEFKRTYGDMRLDLAETGESDRRPFVDALLDAEPNHLGEDFRRELARRAGGHPLFTVELVRAMQARGDLVRDGLGFWAEGPVLNWDTLPARVEGAIEARIARLEPELRETLSVACVEGEDFAVPVVAQVREMDEGALLRQLAQDLARRHRLVVEQAQVQIGPSRFSRFKFSHVLVQDYLYQQLGQGERRLLHGKVAAALESCYGEQVDDLAVQLAYHHSRAGNDGRALHYHTQAARNAHRVYANEEARTHYTRAIEAAKRVSADAEPVIKLYLGRGSACQTLGDFEGALADYEAALRLTGSTGEGPCELLKARTLIDLGRLWASRDYSRAHGYFQEALALARRAGDPEALAGSLNWIGNWYSNAEDHQTAVAYHQEALKIAEALENRQELASTLDLLGIAYLLAGDLTASAQTYDRAIGLCRVLDDRQRLVTCLIARAVTVSALVLLASAPPVPPPAARRDLEEAILIAQEIDSASDEIWALWALGQLHTVRGRFGRAIELVQRGLDIATEIGHREWIVGCRCTLGYAYLELLAPEEARRQLEPALSLAEELRSQVWIHVTTGALAAAYCLLDDLMDADACLESVLSAEAPMATGGQRYCWVRRAELALVQGDPALTMDIVDRLISSAPSASPGRVITFLWMLKGEALAALGNPEEAQPLLQEAIENAQVAGERFLLWRLHASLGKLFCAMGQQPEAEKELSTARELVEELAGTVPIGELRDSFLQRANDWLKSSP